MATWEQVVQDLLAFPGRALQLRDFSDWSEVDGAHVHVTLEVGEVFGGSGLELAIYVGPDAMRLEVQGEPPEGAAEVVSEVSAALASTGGAAAVRSAILRLCTDLCVELSGRESAHLAALGRGAGEEAAEAKPAAAARGLPPGPVALARHTSHATSAGYSFESDDEHVRASHSGDSEGEADEARGGAEPLSLAARLRYQGPSVEDLIEWDGLVDGLKNLRCKQIELQAAGVWDGAEGIVELLLRNISKQGWELLAVTVVVGAIRTRIALKGAQVIPEAASVAVEEVNNRLQSTSSGPSALKVAVCELAKALGLSADDDCRRSVEALGDHVFFGRKKARTFVETGGTSNELMREMMAVEALRMQMELIDGQIQHLERRVQNAPCLEVELRREVTALKRTLKEVEGEKVAGSAAVEAAMLELTDTSGSAQRVEINLQVDDRPAQSLRGHSAVSAVESIRQALSQSGPWAHYAVFQFATMLKREQELQQDFLCLYHSYSHSALLYEVHAELARLVYDLPRDSAPMPRIALAASNAVTSVEGLRGMGGKDHDAAFRALGLSSSCSIFASGSEAPPLTCFQAGYSCTDVSFKSVLVDLIAKCLSDSPGQNTAAAAPTGQVKPSFFSRKTSARRSQPAEAEVAAEQPRATPSARALAEEIATALVDIATKHNLPVSTYEPKNASSTSTQLTGYMLQIFVHRSIAEQFAYPSEPMGVPVKSCTSITKYLDSHGSKADGQARILFHPPTFVDPRKAKLFHYCARPLQSCLNPEVPASRGSLLHEIRSALQVGLAGIPREVLATRLGLR